MFYLVSYDIPDDKRRTKLAKTIKERGRNNFPNYASQLQTTFARSQITKILK